MERVIFKSGRVDVVGHLYLPAGFDEHTRYAAIVSVHPGSSVKEQTAGLYARRMSELGYVTIAFDASYQGESGGTPRFLEDPAARVEDIRAAVDLLTTLDYVDEARIGVLGVCAGGGYAVSAAMTERRIRAVGTVAVTNIGRGYRETGGSEGSIAKTLDAVARQRTAEARGAEPEIVQWIPNSPAEAAQAGVTELDVLEAVDYYRTPRGRHQGSSNQLLARSAALLMAFDAFYLVEELLTQPLQVVIGNRVGAFGSYRDGYELFRRATSTKDLLVIDGASHYDLYDRTEYVDQAVERLRTFYEENLSPREPRG